MNHAPISTTHYPIPNSPIPMSRRRPRKPARIQAKAAPLTLSAAALLVALLAVPAFFNIQSSTSFEPDKGALIRTLAAVALLPLLLGGVQHWRSSTRARWSELAQPLKLLAAFVLLSATATLLSVDPVTSFWGNHERGYGLLTVLAGATFIVVAMQAARAHGPWLLIDAILLAAAIPALYGLLQVVGYDPVRGATVSFVLGDRASSSLGNPLFLADFLLTAVILAAARLFAGPKLRPDARLGLSAYALLLLAALIATFSRSALLAAIIAATFFFLAWGHNRRNRPLQAAGFIVLLGGGLLLIAAWALPDLLPARLGDLFASGGSGGQRLLIWQGVFDMLRSAPARLLTGLGPDAITLRLAPHLPAQLAHFEVDWLFRLPDRAHTLPLDLLAHTGLLGLLLWTGFWSALLARLSPPLRAPFGRWQTVIPVITAIIFAALAALLSGLPASPLGYGAGFLGGALLPLLLAPADVAGPARSPLSPYLLAALAAHWLFHTFSFPTHAPELLTWALIGLVLTVETGPKSQHASPPDISSWQLAGIALAALAFGLSASSSSSLILWAGAFLLLILIAGFLARSSRDWHTLFLPLLLILPAIPLNRTPGLSAWLAYAWLLLWLLAQVYLLIPRPDARRHAPKLALLIPLILLLNLPLFGDIAYKSAILSPTDEAARDILMQRAFALSPHDHILAAGIAPTEIQALPSEASLEHPQAQKIITLYERALAAQPLAPEPPAAYADWLRTRVPGDAAAIPLAFDAFEHALALSPHDIYTRHRLALLRAQTGDLEGAISDLDTLLDLDPLYGPTYLALSEFQRRQGDLAAAAATLERGIANVPWWGELPRALETLQ